MKLTLKIWRQKNASAKGTFVTYKMDDVSPEMSFLEMLDALNKKLIEADNDPVAFDHDCREGYVARAECILTDIHMDRYLQ